MTDRRTPLVLVTGLHRHLGARVAHGLLDRAGTVVVHHDVSGLAEGAVVRTVWRNTDDRIVEVRRAIELAHGCLSCTLRMDLLPLLRSLAKQEGVRRIVLHLDPALEAEQLCWAIADVDIDDHPDAPGDTAGRWVRIEAVLAVLDAASWLDDVTGDEELADRGLGATPDDDRTLAQVALDQVTFADAILLAGEAQDPWDRARLTAVLDRLAPVAPRAELRSSADRLLGQIGPGARRGALPSAHDPLLSGEPPLAEDCGVQWVRVSLDRPLHPQRLHDALDVLLDGVVCSRGRLWLASQHDRVLWVESAGQGLRVGDAGPWLATLDDDAEAWSSVDPQRRVAAALRWDPVYGDRHTELAVLTHRQPALAITAALHAAVLTDEEWSAGPDGWRHYPDPFGSWHEDPCEASTPSDDSTAHATDREDRP